MAERQNIIEAVESFYVDLIERYRDLERQIAGESRILTMFRKVDYKTRIAKLKDLKRKAQGVNLKKVMVDENDELSVQIKEKLGKCQSLFVNVIDAQVSCQTILYKKSEGEKTNMIDYRKAVYGLNRATEELHNCMRSMDADYANLEELE
jgi:hypothetical protein